MNKCFVGLFYQFQRSLTGPSLFMRFYKLIFGEFFKLLLILFVTPVVVLSQTTKEILIHSKALNTDRKIWVNTPEYYEYRKDSFQLVFLLDGNNRSLFEYTVAAKRFLEENAIDLSDYKPPQSIIIGIEQAEDRWQDFGDPVNSAKFLSFLENEVIPYVRSNYRTVNYKILIGHSLGGRFAINTLLDRPNLFNSVIAASPAFPQKFTDTISVKFEAFFKSRLRFDKALYFSTTYMKGDATEEDFRAFSEALEKFLKGKDEVNFRFKFNSSNTLGHGKSPFFSIPEGLHFIYDPSLWQLSPDSLFNNNTSPISAVRRYEQRIKNKFGILISEHPYVPILTDELSKAGKPKEAIALLKSEINKQPTDIEFFARLLALMKKNKDGDYDTYRTKLSETFKKIKSTQKEQEGWLAWIEENSH